MVVYVDAMGGDLAPEAPVKGTVEALRKYPDLKVILAGKLDEIEPHLVFVDVKPGNDEAFVAAITANMRKAIEAEPGVLVMYGATLVDDPNRWVFWEVYASAEAYAAHRDTQHFKDYIAATEDIVAGKEFFVLTADTLVNKGSLN